MGEDSSGQKRVLLVHGCGDCGQLGLGAGPVDISRPRVHSLLNDLVEASTMGPYGIEQVAAGGMHSLVLDSNGMVNIIVFCEVLTVESY